jgi:protein tyrosine/serine phosphatase
MGKGRRNNGPPRWRRAGLAVGVVAMTAAALVGGGLAIQYLAGNLHVVVPGALYRSAQPTPRRIADYHDRYGIRTIINLRGANVGQRWYDDEVRAAAINGIVLLDFPLSANEELTAVQLDQLIAALAAAAKPILIHCESGMDRTGLVSAIYLAAIAGRDEDAAETQMSILLWRLPIPWSETEAMDRSFDQVERRVGIEGS